MLESELFGHTRGAFTGAVAAKKGLFEVADGGSIFLDEIGDIPPETQVRLLRVIQEREFTPLGDTTPRRVDVRIIAATNIDLKEAVQTGNVSRRSLLPAGGRADRIAAACAIGAKTFCRWPSTSFRSTTKRTGARCRSKSRRKCWRCWRAYSWPGNVRELENAIERAVVIAPADEVTRECLRPEISDPQVGGRRASQEGASIGAVQ